MSVSTNDIVMAYRLLLGRAPSGEDIANIDAQNYQDIQSLRLDLLNSEEFERQYDRHKRDSLLTRPATLIHLHIPGTGGEALAATLSDSTALQPDMALPDPSPEALKTLPRPQRRALRYLHGRTSMGTGAALGFPHRYLCLIRRPGPRIFSYYLSVRDGRRQPPAGAPEAQDMSFGDYLEYSVAALPHRLELDNGQIRRLAGAFNHASLGREARILKTALHRALDPETLLGTTEKIGILLERLVAEGYIAIAVAENFGLSCDPGQYESSLEALTPGQRTIVDSYTAWDSYFYDVCQQLFHQMT